MTLRLAAHVAVTETEHGMVLLDQRAGRYWQMNDTAALVLRRLLDGGTVDEAVAALRERFPDAADHAPADVADLIASLRQAKVTAS